MDQNTKNKLTWDDTLVEYLHDSNEDEVVFKQFENSVLPCIKNEDKINWLEVGIGPGTKTLMILKYFKTKFPHKKVYLSVLEPSEKWRDYLKSNGFFKKAKRLCTIVVYPYTLLEYMKMTDIKKIQEFNFITIIHVIYSMEIIEREV